MAKSGDERRASIAAVRDELRQHIGFRVAGTVLKSSHHHFRASVIGDGAAIKSSAALMAIDKSLANCH